MAFKALPFKTEWVEYCDIESLCKRIGAKPTRAKLDGTPLYTVPVIYDPKTKAVVEESTSIAKYLDETYPDTPRLFPGGTFVVQSAFMASLDSIIMSLVGLVLESTCNNLNPVSAEYFKRTRDQTMGQPFEAWIPQDENGREKLWKEVQAGLDKIAGWFSASGDTGPFVMGDTLTFADIDLASRFIWVKVVLGAGSDGWKRVAQLNDGRWAQHLQSMEKYENFA